MCFEELKEVFVDTLSCDAGRVSVIEFSTTFCIISAFSSPQAVR